ncbi:MAG TPA: hypothetical protein VFG66_09610 [Gemmatimonadales bacterium]|nr:hypothetical protein [Gemmatimonadales bacterium]
MPGGEVFAGVLRVDPDSWVLDYAGLWRAERPPDPVHPAGK